MRELRHLVSAVFAVTIVSWSCFQPVDERQCDALDACGSGWQCVNFRCVPPGAGDGGFAGGQAGGRVTGGGSAGGRTTGGGFVMAGGIGGGGRPTGGGFVMGGGLPTGGGIGGGGGRPMGGGGGIGGEGGGFGGGGPCAGCFLNGTCFDPTGTQYCGAAGSVCTQCQLMSETCQNGRCTPTNGCDAMSCPGCCQGPGGSCVPLAAQLNFACGRGGAMCTQCPPGMNCNAQGNCVAGPACGPMSCAGCCIQGACLAPFLQSELVCGANGVMCTSCTPGQTCLNGQCTGGPPTCSPRSCPTGCCSNNQCIPLPAQSAVQCGTGGQQCSLCPPGGVCSNGFCSAPSCSPGTCPDGCCILGQCLQRQFQNSNVCGLFGQLCDSCGPGRICNNGSCQSPFDAGVCNATTCPGGCCQNGVCQPGTSTFSCGGFGSQCVNCPGGTVCSNGFCTAPPTCSPANCPGCCQNGVCQPGTSTFSCGAFGSQCTSCPGGTSCSNGFCTGPPACSPATCAGCCQNGVCRPGNQQSACGVFGNQCFNCPPNAVCSNGSCTLAQSPTGSSCTNSNTCEPNGAGICFPWPGGGYCSSACTGMTGSCQAWQQCAGLCPSGAACVGSGATLLPFCAATCPGPQGGQSTCRAGYVCAAFGTSSSTGICRPACTSVGFGCPGGGSCNTTTGYCQ